MLGCPCRIPKQQRHVSKRVYVVQPGDDVGTIARRFGVPARRYGELVGANLHKRLGDAPYGYKHRVFEDLGIGEELAIPSSWMVGVSGPFSELQPRPGYSPSIDRLGLFVDAIMATPIPSTVMNLLAASGLSLPTGTTIEDAIAVVFSWWPYVKWPGGFKPPLPTPGTALPDTVVLTNLLRQAVEFLRWTGIKDGAGPQVQDIPWDAVLWQSVPWNQIGPFIGQLSDVMGTVPVPVYATLNTPKTNQVPDFQTAEWQHEDWIKFLSEVTFSDGLAELLGDPEAVACMKANPDRCKKLLTCKDCYTDSQQFKAILCSATPADPCQCKAIDPKDDPNKEDPNKDKPPSQSGDDDKTALIAGAVVIGVLGIAATAFMLSGRK